MSDTCPTQSHAKPTHHNVRPDNSPFTLVLILNLSALRYFRYRDNFSSTTLADVSPSIRILTLTLLTA